MFRKTGPATIKSMSDAGKGSAVFATLNVIDKDGDLTIAGAFGEQMAKFVGAHNWGDPSIGGSKIREEGDLAIADFQINLDMTAGQEWYKSLKYNFENGIPQEFSYGFDVLKYSYKEEGQKTVRILESMKVHEVSPVMVGAGVGTQLRNMKSGSRSMDEHFESVCFEVEDFVSRAMSLTAMRSKESRHPLSLTMKERIKLLSAKLTELLKTSAEDPSPNSNVTPKEVFYLKAQWLKNQQRASGL